jgi:hypothetical protein
MALWQPGRGLGLGPGAAVVQHATVASFTADRAPGRVVLELRCCGARRQHTAELEVVVRSAVSPS